MPRFASVAVNIAQINELFDYEIPEMLDGVLRPGVLVIVTFGSQRVQGVVVNLKDGYNGDLTSREAGSVGGQMVKKMIESYEKNL